MRRLGLLVPLLVVVWAVWPARGDAPDPPAARPSPWALAAARDGRVLYAACGPTGTVAVIDVAERRVIRMVPVGGTPRGLAVSDDDATLAVSLEGRDEVVLFDLPACAERARIAVGADPEGLAFRPDGRRLYVANRLSQDVSIVDVARATVSGRVQAGREPFALVRSPDGRTLAVVSRRADLAPADQAPQTEVTLLDAETGEVRSRVHLPSCHLCEAGAFTADSRHLLVPAIRVHNLLPIVQVARGWVLYGALAVVDVARGTVRVLPLAYANEGFADPAGIVVSQDVARAFVAAGGNDEVGVIDVDALLARGVEGDLGRTWRYVERRVAVGDDPRGMVWLGYGVVDAEVAVSNRLDDTITLLDVRGGVLATIPVGPRIPDDELQRGRRAFFDASYCFQGAFSCTSCHPEGHTDGLTYDFDIDGVGRNVVLNRSLLGLQGTAPFKWTGINPSLQRQCGARFAMVLTRADLFPPETLDAMAAWLLSRPPPRPTVDRELDPEAVERGRRIFARGRAKDGRRLRPGQRCITCHPPPLYTNNQITEVGTRGPRDDHEAYDTPHLTGGGSKAPYLHDGRAITLEDIFAGSPDDRHGFVGDLTPEEIRDLVAFLESL